MGSNEARIKDLKFTECSKYFLKENFTRKISVMKERLCVEGIDICIVYLTTKYMIMTLY